MTLRPLALLLLLALLLAPAACGGDDGPGDAPDVDRVAAAVQDRDSETLLDLIGYQQVVCTTAQPDVAGPPPCRAVEKDGDLVDVVPIAGCESSYLRPSDVPNALAHLLDRRPTVYAAFEAPESWDSGDYAVVFTDSQQGAAVATQLVIEGGKIVLLDLGCGESPEEKVAGIDEHSFVIKPAEPSTTPEGT